MPGPNGGRAVFDVPVSAAGAAGNHRNLTGDMAVCPTCLAQVTDRPPLALFADGLDTAVYQLDPGAQRFRYLSAMSGLAESLTASHSGQMIAAAATTSYEPVDVYAGPPGLRLARISETSPDLRRIPWGTQERLSYQAADRLDLDGLLILPPGKSEQTAPSRSSRWCTAAPTDGTPTGS